jgi:hypothetical protein
VNGIHCDITPRYTDDDRRWSALTRVASLSPVCQPPICAMSDDDLIYDSLYQLTTHADHLNAIDTPDPGATVKYEILSGALIWSDETRRDTPVYVVWAIRELFAYRTLLMLNDIEPDNDRWAQCVRLFPNWVGFLPERRKRTPELLREYRRGRISLRRCLRELDRETGTGEAKT